MSHEDRDKMYQHVVESFTADRNLEQDTYELVC